MREYLERLFYFLQSRKKRLIVKDTETMGRGVFALRDIKNGEIIDKTPVLAVPADEVPDLLYNIITYYVFEWKKGSAIALGITSLINHSNSDRNVSYENDFKRQLIIFKAERDIKAGEQLFIDYGYDAKRKYKEYQNHKKRPRSGYKRKFDEGEVSNLSLVH